LLNEIEKEVLFLEDQTFSDNTLVNLGHPSPPVHHKQTKSTTLPKSLSSLSDEKAPDSPVSAEKIAASTTRLTIIEQGQTRFAFRTPPVRLTIRRLRRYLRRRFFSAFWFLCPWLAPVDIRHSRVADAERDPAIAASAATLRRMGRTRRLVTTLSRLLATKSDVVARIQKRLLTQVHGELATAPTAAAAIPLDGTVRAANGSGSAFTLEGTTRTPSGVLTPSISRHNEANEVAIYYGDVQGMRVA
jgi:magnesium transporter